MARFRKRIRPSGFRVSDLMRLMSMVGMLCVVALVIFRARDASMWRWVISDSQPSNGPPAQFMASLPAQQSSLPAPQEPNAPAKPAEKPKSAPSTSSQPTPLTAQSIEEPAKAEAAPAQAADADKTSATVQATAETPEQTGEEKPVAAADEQVSTPPSKTQASHLNPIEWEQAQYEFQLIQDKTPVENFDMPAYWRILNWVKSQSGSELAARSDRDATFTDFVQRPNQMRGKLVRLKLHMLRSKRYEVGTNPYGFKWLYEVWGYTNDSNPYPYVIVFADWPQGMPLGNNLAEEATVDAYFLKQLKYEAHDSKLRISPLMLGRLVWHPNPLRQASEGSTAANDIWSMMLVGGGLGIAFLGYLVFRIVAGKPNVPVAPALTSTTSTFPEGWGEDGTDSSNDVPAFLRSESQASADGFIEESGREQAG